MLEQHCGTRSMRRTGNPRVTLEQRASAALFRRAHAVSLTFAGRTLAVLLAFCLLVPTLASCTLPVMAWRQEPPSLYIESLSGTIPAFRNAFTWPASPEGLKHLERKETSPEPAYVAATAPGETLQFTLRGCPRKPQSVFLELFDSSVFTDPDAWEPLYSFTWDSAALYYTPLVGNEMTLSWTVPLEGANRKAEGLNPQDIPRWDKDDYCLSVYVLWDTPEETLATLKPIHVQYIARLAIADKELIERAAQLSEEVFRAAWEGDQETIAALIPDVCLENETNGTGESNYPSNPFDTRMESWESILWESDEMEFSLASDPQFHLAELRSHSAEPYAKVDITYKVKVKDNEGRSGLWSFRESYRLELGKSVTKPLSFMERRGEPDFDENTPPEWLPKVSREGQVSKVGPFCDLSWPYGVWSDDGKYMAFIACESTGHAGIWVVSRDGSELKPLYILYEPETPVPPTYLHLLGWAPDQHKVRFYVSGYQPGPGPDAEDCGFWFAEADVATGETRSVAFLRSGRWRVSNKHVTKDRNDVIVRDPDSLWRVNLVTGETVRLAEDIRPPGYDLFNLRFSPSGWYAADVAWEEDGLSLVVYDMKTGVRTDIPFPGNYMDPNVQGSDVVIPFFLSWTSDELLTVGLADKEHVGSDSGFAVGFQKLQFYSPDGTLRRELEHPGATIGAWAWTDNADKLAYTLVSVSKGSSDPVSPWNWQGFYCELKEVWVQDAAHEDPYQLASLTDQPNAISASMSWTENDTALEIWFYPDYWEPSADRRGVRINLDGEITPLSQPSNRLDVACPCGTIGDTSYYVLRTQEGSRVFAVDTAGNETVIYEGSARDLTTEVYSDVFLTVVGESRWDMLGHRAYILLHQPQ